MGETIQAVNNSISGSKWTFFTYWCMVSLSLELIYCIIFWDTQFLHGLSPKQEETLQFSSVLCAFVGLLFGGLFVAIDHVFRTRFTGSVAMATIICPIGILSFHENLNSSMFPLLVLLYAVSGLGVGILSGVAWLVLMLDYPTYVIRGYTTCMVCMAVTKALFSSGLFNYLQLLVLFIVVQAVSSFICIFLLKQQLSTEDTIQIKKIAHWCWSIIFFYLASFTDPIQVNIATYLGTFITENHLNTRRAIKPLILPVVMIPYAIISDIYIDKVPLTAYCIGLLILKLPLQLAFIFSEDNIVLMIFIVICTYCSIAIMAVNFPGVFITFFGENFFSLNFAAASLTAAVYFILIEVLLGLFYEVNIDKARRQSCSGTPCLFVPLDVVCVLSVLLLMLILIGYVIAQRLKKSKVSMTYSSMTYTVEDP